MEHLGDDAELLASELVANAAEHGDGTPIGSALRRHDKPGEQPAITCHRKSGASCGSSHPRHQAEDDQMTDGAAARIEIDGRPAAMQQLSTATLTAMAISPLSMTRCGRAKQHSSPRRTTGAQRSAAFCETPMATWWRSASQQPSDSGYVLGTGVGSS
jgi:hypothetical protein